MIAPAPANLEVTRREPFQSKTKALHQRDRTRVVRLNVGFEPVKSELAETVGDDQAQPGTQKSASGKGLECVVTKVRRLEAAAHDFADVHDAGDVIATRHHDEAFSIALAEVPNVLRKLGPIVGR